MGRQAPFALAAGVVLAVVAVAARRRRHQQTTAALDVTDAAALARALASCGGRVAAWTALARALDNGDPLRRLRSQFLIPLDRRTGRDFLYFSGNSLGLCSRACLAGLRSAGDVWSMRGGTDQDSVGYGGVEARRALLEADLSRLGGAVVGALPHEVVFMNALTVNLQLLLATFYHPAPGARRHKILVEHSAFHSDQYAVASHLEFCGFGSRRRRSKRRGGSGGGGGSGRGSGSGSGSVDGGGGGGGKNEENDNDNDDDNDDEEQEEEEEDALVVLRPRPGESTLRTEDVVQAIARLGDRLALVLMGGVHYVTGQLLDMHAVTRAAHAAGALAGFDLAHAAGNVPLRLHDWDVDFAAWCSYKYVRRRVLAGWLLGKTVGKE